MIFTVVPCRPKESFFPWAKIKFVLKFIVRDKKNTKIQNMINTIFTIINIDKNKQN